MVDARTPTSGKPAFSRESLVFWAGLLGATGAIFTTGRSPEGSLGIFLVSMGAAMIALRPAIGLDWRWFAASAGLVICAVLTLMPQGWAGMPAWREALSATAVPLGTSVSPVPRETLFWALMMAISAPLFLFLLSQPVPSRQLLIFANGGIGVVAIYAGMAIYSRLTGWVYPFDFDPTFGFFPNRNNTAAFLVAGSILSLGVLGVARQGRHWLSGTVAGGGLGLDVAALFFFSESRGGVVFLIIGTLLWVLGLGRRHWSKPLMVSFAGIFCAGAMLFFLSKGEARHRVIALFDRGAPKEQTQRMTVGEDISSEGRLLIYTDTMRMIRDFPITGVGLGAFRWVFPFYREASLAEARSIHPESDWLMLAAEAGLPAVLVAGGCLWFLLRRIGPERDHPYWPLRLGFVCAVAAVLLHGMVDVPVHRIALGWWLLVLAGLGFQIFPRNPQRRLVGQRLIFCLAGFAAFAMGVLLVRAEWFGGPSMPPWAAAKAQVEIEALSKQDQLEPAMEVASRAIAASPMACDLYYQKGVLKLGFEDTDAEVDALFAAQRALNPDWPQIPIEEGQAWMNYDLARAAALWQDAIERQRRIDKALGRGEKHDLALFDRLLQLGALHPDLQKRLLFANEAEPSMVLLWLERTDKSLAAAEILRLSQVEKFLSGLEEKDQSRFLRAWYQKSDRPALALFIESHHDWSVAGWPFTVRLLVDAKKYEAAIQAVAARYQISLDLNQFLTGQLQPLASQSEDPVAAFAYHWKTGNQITARRILQEAQTPADGKNTPAEIWRLSAILSVQESRWDTGWTQLANYLQKSGMDASPEFR